MGVGSRTQQGPASPRSAAPPLSPSPPAPGAEPALCQPDTSPRACLQGVSARGRGEQDDVCILSPRARAVRTAEEGAPGSSRAGGRGGRRAGGGAATRRGCDLGPSKGAESAGVRGWAAGSQRLNTHGRAERGDGGEGRLRWFWPGQKWLVGTWCRLDTCPEPRSAPPRPRRQACPLPLHHLSNSSISCKPKSQMVPPPGSLPDSSHEIPGSFLCALPTYVRATQGSECPCRALLLLHAPHCRFRHPRSPDRFNPSLPR